MIHTKKIIGSSNCAGEGDSDIWRISVPITNQGKPRYTTKRQHLHSKTSSDCLLVAHATSRAYAGSHVAPDSVRVFQHDADTAYQVLGVLEAGAEDTDSTEVGPYLLSEIKKLAAKQEMNAVISTEITNPKRGSLVEADRKDHHHKSIPFSFIRGIGVHLLDSAETVAWEKSHPPMEFDRKDSVRIFDGDVERRYVVRGIAYTYVRSKLYGRLHRCRNRSMPHCANMQHARDAMLSYSLSDPMTNTIIPVPLLE